jgi:TonB-dependent starch-binding outer membrane protein SusC
MQGVKAISNLKLRASWGKIGNQDIGDYRYTGVINNFAKYLFGQSYYSSGGTISSAVNPALQWETTTQTNIGIDAGFLNDKFSLTLDYFNKVTSDILLETPIPSSTGFESPPTVNVGKVKNYGIEITGAYQGQAGDFTWNVAGNISFIKNEVEALNSEKAFVPGNGDNSNDGRAITRTQAGHPIGAFYGLAVEKIYQNYSEIYYDNAKDGNSSTPYGGSAIRPGDIKFKDINGDGKIDANDRTFIGSPTPNTVFGLFLRGGYKGFDLQAQFQGVQGSEIYNAARFWTEGMQRNFNYDSRTLNRFISESSPGNGLVPRANSNDANNGQISNRYVEDGSYLRLKNLTVGYDLTKLLRSVKGISRLRVYFTANNLLTITNYSGYDPEIGAGYETDAQRSNRNRNIDNANYPYPKTFLVGIQIGL